MWPSASRAQERSTFMLIGTPGDRRVELFQAALAGLGKPPAHVVSYSDVLNRRISFSKLLSPQSIVRIESPGKSVEIEQQLLAEGSEQPDPDPDHAYYERLPRKAIDALPTEKGRLLASRQWYLGYRAVLDALAAQIPREQCMSHPDEIALMFDKRACHAFLQARGLPVPPSLPAVRSYEELLAQMSLRRWNQVFVKLAHGSSASGVVAYRHAHHRYQALTVVEMVHQNGELHLYNTRKIQLYQDQRQIATLIDALCRQRVHVEYWLPKEGLAGRVCDLRVVTIAGKACHSVVRLSRSPMTNLHLLNARGDLHLLQERIGEDGWQGVRKTCEQAASLFSSLSIGIDLLFTSHFRRHAIAELNAFGDLLPGILHDNQDTYTAEIEAARSLCWT